MSKRKPNDTTCVQCGCTLAGRRGLPPAKRLARHLTASSGCRDAYAEDDFLVAIGNLNRTLVIPPTVYVEKCGYQAYLLHGLTPDGTLVEIQVYPSQAAGLARIGQLTTQEAGAAVA